MINFNQISNFYKPNWLFANSLRVSTIMFKLNWDGIGKLSGSWNLISVLNVFLSRLIFILFFIGPNQTYCIRP